MITKIKRIKTYGVFKDFNWDKNIPDFKEYNAIYAWNYSGKTTLSRIFRSFELQKINEDYKEGNFEIEINDRSLTETELSYYPNIRVYNSDFVKDNLRWYNESENIAPIFVIGEESIELQEKLENQKNSLMSQKKNYLELNDKLRKMGEDLYASLQTKARDIKDILKLQNFTQKHLKEIIEEVEINYKDYLTIDTNQLLNTCQYNEDKEVINQPRFDNFLAVTFLSEIKQLVSKKVFSETIDKLKIDTRLQNWIYAGKEIHKNKTICEFCGNNLPTDLLDKYEKHFSNEFEQIIQNIEELERRIRNHILDLQRTEGQYPNEAKFYREYSDEYIKHLSNLHDEVALYIKNLENSMDILIQKKNNPFDILDFNPYPTNTDTIMMNYKSIENLIVAHNNKRENINKVRTDAVEKMKRYYAAHFIEDNNYFEKLSKQRDQSIKIKQLENDINISNREILKLESSISESVKGATKINYYLGLLFNNDSISIASQEDAKFVLKRGTDVAKNLSEGEKSAISFAYFLAKLEDKETELKKTTIFIDDPVCSLDNNHLYNIFSIITNIFGGKKCYQFFISTHNFLFFNLMKDFIKKELKIDKFKSTDPFYYIERLFGIEKESHIIGLPSQLRNFRSEYVYIFSIIYEFYRTRNNDYKLLYQIPNLIRKFLETYLGFRCPDAISWTQKLDILITNEITRCRIDKFLNEFSHNQTSDMINIFPDFHECLDITDIIVESIKTNDVYHYEALVSNCA